MINRKIAFTLAEVLITLGIIGIVAALTIPTLMAKTKKQQTTVALKKFYSTMQQAIKLSELDNGEVEDWEYDNSKPNAGRTFFNTYLAKYMQFVKTEDNGSNNYNVYFADGSTVDFGTGGCVDMNFDANGEKKPNIIGKDIFDFPMCISAGQSLLYKKSATKHFGAYYEGITRDEALTRCKSFALSCSALLLLDNWEFKDDYPYNI